MDEGCERVYVVGGDKRPYGAGEAEMPMHANAERSGRDSPAHAHV